MAKELKIYKRLPAGWFVTRYFTTVKNGYIGIHNGKNPFSSKGEYRSGQILITPAILKHLGKQYQTDKSSGVTAKKTDRQQTAKAVKAAKKKVRKQLLKANRKKVARVLKSGKVRINRLLKANNARVAKKIRENSVRLADVLRGVKHKPKKRIQTVVNPFDFRRTCGNRKKETFEQRLKRCSDVHTVRDKILYSIADGSYKFKWSSIEKEAG